MVAESRRGSAQIVQGSLVSMLPQVAQIMTLAPNNLLLYAERRCNVSGAFSGEPSRITPASLYGVNAYAIAYDKDANTLAVTDRAGTLTIYRVPRSGNAK